MFLTFFLFLGVILLAIGLSMEFYFNNKIVSKYDWLTQKEQRDAAYESLNKVAITLILIGGAIMFLFGIPFSTLE